jgi:hypothetical protein
MNRRSSPSATAIQMKIAGGKKRARIPAGTSATNKSSERAARPSAAQPAQGRRELGPHQTTQENVKTMSGATARQNSGSRPPSMAGSLKTPK